MDKVKDMLLKFLRLDRLVNSMMNYLESRVALVKMEVREEVANILSRGLMIIIIFLVGFLFLLFLSIGLAQYLNGLFEGQYMGYVFLSGFYGVVLLLLILLRKNFFRALEKQFVEMIKHKHP